MYSAIQMCFDYINNITIVLPCFIMRLIVTENQYHSKTWIIIIVILLWCYFTVWLHEFQTVSNNSSIYHVKGYDKGHYVAPRLHGGLPWGGCIAQVFFIGQLVLAQIRICIKNSLKIVSKRNDSDCNFSHWLITVVGMDLLFGQFAREPNCTMNTNTMKFFNIISVGGFIIGK